MAQPPLAASRSDTCYRHAPPEASRASHLVGSVDDSQKHASGAENMMHPHLSRYDESEALQPNRWIAMSLDERREPYQTDYTVSWEGVSDSGRPFNWPSSKKYSNLLIVSLICVLSPLASSVVAPALGNIMADFRSTDTYIPGLIISIYVLGWAVGPLFVGPLSELYGRLPAYHACNVIFTVFTCLCAVSPNINTLLAMRFLAGCGGSGAFVLAPATAADLYPPSERGGMMGIVAACYNLGPTLGPVVGGFTNANSNLGWKWIFWICALVGAFCTLITLGLSETYEPILLQRKARQLRKKTGDSRYVVEQTDHLTHLQRFVDAMKRPIQMLWYSPNVLLTCLLCAVGYAILYLLYTTFTNLFLFVYHWRASYVGLAFLGTGLGNILGMLVGGAMAQRHWTAKVRKGSARPEDRIQLMIYFWPCVIIGLLIFGWTAKYEVHWVGPLIGTAIFGMGYMATMLYANLYAVDAFPLHAASAAAANVFLRSLFAGVIPIFGSSLYGKMNFGVASSILAAIAGACWAIPICCYQLGERLRGERYRYPRLSSAIV